MNSDSARSSWATSSTDCRPNRNTQSSFASSRTSYCSFVDFPEARYSGASLSRHVDRAFGPRPTGNDTAVAAPDHDFMSTGSHQSAQQRFAKIPSEALQARCPWCATTFTRAHDFKKHAREFHLSRSYWQCRNAACRERTYSERQAKIHPNRSRSVDCKNLGSAVIVLQCDRKHFGCPHCARYFGDAEPYLTHMTRDCRPGKAPRRAHQSLQIRGLLQQPGVISHVRKYCSQLRGDSEAYNKLWWAWDKATMAEIIERLEYGVQPQLDQQIPGIASDSLGSFLQSMLAPSSKSIFEAEITQRCSLQSIQGAEEKPLPPLPNEGYLSGMQVLYDQGSMFQQTRSYLQLDRQQQPATPSSNKVEEWCLQQPCCDPMIGGSFSDHDVDGFQAFEWDHLARDMNLDPKVGLSFPHEQLGYR